MINGVHYLRDDEAETIIHQVEPETVVLPMFDALLAGPASPMDPPPMPRNPKPEPGWSVCLWLTISGWAMGVAQAVVIMRWF